MFRPNYAFKNNDPADNRASGHTVPCFQQRKLRLFHTVHPRVCQQKSVPNIRYLFPNEATLEDMALRSRLAADGTVRFLPYITHALHGLETFPEASLVVFTSRFTTIESSLRNLPGGRYLAQ